MKTDENNNATYEPVSLKVPPLEDTGEPQPDLIEQEKVQAGPMSQEPKYRFVNDHVINRASGEAIPFDEPVFVLRGRDVNAVHTLIEYQSRCADANHYDVVGQRLQQFLDFKNNHPERMKEPDTVPFPK